MKKFENHYHEPLNYLREKDIESPTWYEIRDNLLEWYIQDFAGDSIGMDMLVEYVRKQKKIESNTFFENMVNSVLFSKLSKKEQKEVYQIAKNTFMDGLFYFEESYILNLVEKESLEKYIENNILIQDEEKLRFQNILLQSYLAACKIYEEKIEINDSLFEKWLDEDGYEYLNHQIEIFYIFSMIHLELFNQQYLKPKIEKFLAKIDTKNDFTIAQSIMDMYEIAVEFGEEYPRLFLSTEEDYCFIKFLGLDIEGDIIEHDYEPYESMLNIRYTDENGIMKIDYTKMKEDKFLMKWLDEDGTIEKLVEDYKILKRILKKMQKELDKDYCDDWEIKGLGG